jgi:hypothetical protein
VIIKIYNKKDLTLIFSPVGNFIGSTTSDFTEVESLQCIKVSSKSKTKVFLSINLQNTFVIFLLRKLNFFLVYL